jgi:ribosomal protein S18 acetylase RimI-like enzyme
MEIVEATIDDLDRVAEICLQVGELHSEIFKKRTIEDDKKMLEPIISSTDDDDIMYIAKEDHIIKGFCIITAKSKAPSYKNNKVGFIESMGVDKKYHKEGIGKTLINKAKEWTKEKELSKLELNVYTFNDNAVKFYENLGFEKFSQRMDVNI